jgi:hypothetical protein
MISQRLVTGLALETALLASTIAPVAAQAHDRVYVDNGCPIAVYPGNSYYGRYHRHYPARAYYFPSYYTSSYYSDSYEYGVPFYSDRLTIIYRIR